MENLLDLISLIFQILKFVGRQSSGGGNPKLDRARKLIDQSHYEEALDDLSQIDDPEARQWEIDVRKLIAQRDQIRYKN